MEIYYIKKCCSGSKNAYPILLKVVDYLRKNGIEVKIKEKKPNELKKEAQENKIELWYLKKHTHIMINGKMTLCDNLVREEKFKAFVSELVESVKNNKGA